MRVTRMATSKWPERVVGKSRGKRNAPPVNLVQLLGVWTLVSVPVSLVLGPLFARRADSLVAAG